MQPMRCSKQLGALSDPVKGTALVIFAVDPLYGSEWAFVRKTQIRDAKHICAVCAVADAYEIRQAICYAQDSVSGERNAMNPSTIPAYEVTAFNLAAASENKIHDDSVARRLGFQGALVPGVVVYAYMAHSPVARGGRAWLERGEADCRFLKPVYDGAVARVTATDDTDVLTLVVESAGLRCAAGRAFTPTDRRAAPAVDALSAGIPPKQRPKASETSLAPGLALGIAPVIINRVMLATYLNDIKETDPIYSAEGLVHPGQILRLANQALLENVVLGPWIHTESKVRHYAVARVGEELTLRSRITSNVVVKGHAVVKFDAIVIADGARTVAEITHAAIWRPRQVAEADASRSA
jgi:acyl dehydratase